MVPHKHHGGLGLLDPLVQQLKLQWRWVADLLLPTTFLSQPKFVAQTFMHTSVPYIKYSLSALSMEPSSYMWPLLFPSRRSHFSSLRVNAFKSLFALVDALPPLSVSTARLSGPTFLQFDLVDFLTFPSATPTHVDRQKMLQIVFPNNPGFYKLRVQDFFVYNNSTASFRGKTAQESQFPSLSRKFWQAYFADKLSFNAQVYNTSSSVDLSPLVATKIDALQAFFEDSKSLGLHLRLAQFPVQATTAFSPQQWKLFWKTSIPPSARTVWYRALHRKLPNKQLLHRIIPTTFPTPNCQHCPQTIDDLEHFLVKCPQKLLIWRHTVSQFSPNIHITEDNILDTILNLNPSINHYQSTVIPTVSFFDSIGCILLSIWRAHWKTVFDNIPFMAATVQTDSCSLLWNLHFENEF